MYVQTLQVFAWLEIGENLVLEIEEVGGGSLFMQLKLKAGLVKR